VTCGTATYDGSVCHVSLFVGISQIHLFLTKTDFVPGRRFGSLDYDPLDSWPSETKTSKFIMFTRTLAVMCSPFRRKIRAFVISIQPTPEALITF
jgi:hypothetical protein